MVKFIKYKGVEYPISISYYAMERLEDEGLSLGDESLKSMLRLFWHSLVAGHFHQDKELTLKEEHAPFILDECFSEFKAMLPLFLEKLVGQNGQTAKPKTKKKPVTRS